MALKIKRLTLFFPTGPRIFTPEQIAESELDLALGPGGAVVAFREGPNRDLKRYFNVPIEILDEVSLVEPARGRIIGA